MAIWELYRTDDLEGDPPWQEDTSGVAIFKLLFDILDDDHTPRGPQMEWHWHYRILRNGHEVWSEKKMARWLTRGETR